MNKIIYVGLFLIILVSFSLASLNRIETKKSDSMPISTSKTTLVSKIDNAENIVDACPSFDIVVKKMLNAKTYENWLVSLKQLSQESIFKDLEKAALINNECGGSASVLLFHIYSDLGLKDKAYEIYERLSKFAAANNSSAIRFLCENQNKIISGEERVRYCEIVLNSDNPSFKDDKEHVKTILFGVYKETKQIDKIFNLCEKGSKYITKNACSWALYSIGKQFYEEKKFDLAIDAFEKSSIYDDSGMSESKLAYMYFDGDGVPQDNAIAVFWFEKSLKKLENENSELKKYVRLITLNNIGAASQGLMNFVDAFRYYKEAAMLGLAQSQWNLAKLYSDGHGILQDEKEAYAWVSVAIAQGLEHGDKQYQAETLKSNLTFRLALKDESGGKLKQAQELAQQSYKQYVLHEKPVVKAVSKSFVTRFKAAINAFQNN